MVALLTQQVAVADGPRFCCIEVRVSSYAIAWEVSVGQEASFTVKRTGVSVEAVGEEEHDVGKVFHLISDVAVRDLSESQRSDAFPHFEGFSDGLKRLVFPNFRRVVLYAEKEIRKGGLERQSEKSRP